MSDKYKLTYVPKAETDFLYSADNPITSAKIGCIGRVRGDFGRNGNEFWSTWLDFCYELKTRALSEELDDFINTLRDGGILESRAAMSAYCAENMQAKLADMRGDNFGFKATTDNHVFYLRCIPFYGDYNIYCYAFDRKTLESYLSMLH